VSWERVRLTTVGWSDDLALEQTDEAPAPSGDQVLVEVEACGVCYRDCIDRAGRFPFIRTPVTPGHEAVGRVAAVGPDVSEWQVGDRVGTMHRDHCGACAACASGKSSLCEAAYWVFGIMADGGYAQRLLAPERAFFAVPDSIDAAHAAVMHCTFGTAWRNLVTVGGLRSGERLLVTGANGGVGCAAVQIGHRFDCEVIAVVRDEAHVELLTGLGATHVVVDSGESFHKGLPGGRVDIAIENVGQPTFNASLRSLRLGGRLAIVGNVVEERAALNLGYIVVNGLQLFGAGGATRSDMAALFDLHAERPFEFAIQERLPLARADEAQRRVKRGGLQGRLVLIP